MLGVKHWAFDDSNILPCPLCFKCDLLCDFYQNRLPGKKNLSLHQLFVSLQNLQYWEKDLLFMREMAT